LLFRAAPSPLVNKACRRVLGTSIFHGFICTTRCRKLGIGRRFSIRSFFVSLLYLMFPSDPRRCWAPGVSFSPFGWVVSHHSFGAPSDSLSLFFFLRGLSLRRSVFPPPLVTLRSIQLCIFTSGSDAVREKAAFFFFFATRSLAPCHGSFHCAVPQPLPGLRGYSVVSGPSVDPVRPVARPFRFL